MGKATALKRPFLPSAAEPEQKSDPYSAFERLDGDHPWKEWVPEGQVPYKARRLGRGDVAYFNFDLAREVGLISNHHPSRMNAQLKKKILETFSIRIINEYDHEHKISYPESQILPGEFMATRYLQLQHPNKRGETSGDGRCIWNGHLSANGKLWDISSRGTGVTCLAPGVVLAGKSLRTGNNDHGYGCGLAEMDELYAAAIMAEIFHRRGISTERVLAIIDFGDGFGIGVRAAPNLIRPAHLFRFLKSGNHEALQRATDYLIQRQQRNREWRIGVHQKNRYQAMLEEITSSFSRFGALLEREYIFAWLDWDGDNVLANAGIIDYGSVRQFGLRHDQYRYDDIERWSTNLNEQRRKARATIQVFIQMVDFLETKVKKPFDSFDSHPMLTEFDKKYEAFLREIFLGQLGFSLSQIAVLMEKNKNDVDEAYALFTRLEGLKTSKSAQEVADGINRPAILNMRNFCRAFPALLKESGEAWSLLELSSTDLFYLVLAESVTGRDTRPRPSILRNLDRLQVAYKKLIANFTEGQDASVLNDLCKRAHNINREDRLTGNALLFIVSDLMRARKQGTSHRELQGVIDDLIHSQAPPEKKPKKIHSILHTRRSQKILQSALRLIHGYREDI